MVKAVLQNGKIVALEPLPSEWREGQELRVDETNHRQSQDGSDAIERGYAELDALCSQGNPEEDRRLQAALTEAHEQAKAGVRKQMGLP